MLDPTLLLRGYARLRKHTLARKSAAAHQAQTLQKLVTHAKSTRFGRDHDFGAIQTVEDFQARVPLRSYEDFHAEYFAQTFPIIDDVTWPGRIPYFAVSSGTAIGASKHIPVSRHMLRSNARAGTDLLAHHVRANPGSDVLAGKSFMLGGSVAMTELAPGVLAGDLSGIARLNNPRWSTPFVFPSIEEALEADWERKIDRLARLSLDEPIRCLAGTPNWLLLFFERLKALTGRGQDLRAFYPKLDLLVYGGMSFAPYRDTFKAWCPGGGIDWREVYSASEGFVASADAGIDDGMMLNTDIGLFFEFVPMAEWDAPNPTRYWLGNAPPGEYGLILSTCAGLWAYRIGDVVELLDTTPPRVKVTGRVSYYLSAFGEHLSAAELERGVLAAAARVGAGIAEYAVTPLFPTDAEPRGRHLFVVELAGPQGDAGWRPDPLAAAPFAATLDETLAAGNDDYAVHRRKDVQMMPPEVAFVPPGAFADWMRDRGKLGGQNKVPRVVLAGDVRDSLLAFARARRIERAEP
ncbi:MAG: GH3 auxin-responsive promoter family protein [Pseudomonadota bacterium]